MNLGYFTIHLENEDLGLTPKDIKALCEGVSKRFRVLALHRHGTLVIAGLKGTEHELTQIFERSLEFIEQKVGRISASDYRIEDVLADDED